MKVQVVTVKRTINAPLKYTFEWCTDFRETDSAIVGSSRKKIIIEKSKKRVIYAALHKESDGRTRVSIYFVTLGPPNSWHLDMFDPYRNETGDYRLKRLNKRRTQLTMTFKNKWKAPARAEKSSKFIERLNEHWTKYICALEADYPSSRHS